MARREKVHVEVDDATIAGDDPHAVIHPVWWRADIYDGPGMYDHSLREFSRPQRHVFAVLWYIAEVNNGGHHQVYSNSTGIVWRDAMEGFEAIGVPRAAKIVAVSADRLGGSPSQDREERYDQMEAFEPDFEDLDDAFYQLQKKVNLDEQMMSFIRSRPESFYFSGTIETVALPRRGGS